MKARQLCTLGDWRWRRPAPGLAVIACCRSACGLLQSTDPWGITRPRARPLSLQHLARQHVQVSRARQRRARRWSRPARGPGVPVASSKPRKDVSHARILRVCGGARYKALARPGAPAADRCIAREAAPGLGHAARRSRDATQSARVAGRRRLVARLVSGARRRQCSAPTPRAAPRCTALQAHSPTPRHGRRLRQGPQQP